MTAGMRGVNSHFAGDGADIDDGAALAGGHVGDDGLCHADDGVYVGVENANDFKNAFSAVAGEVPGECLASSFTLTSLTYLKAHLFSS